ncbi:MAG: S8 family serine peptidase, partial [Pseudobdellovibrionaceae bacterium]
IQVEVKPGTYFIRVKAKSTNFTSKDQLRITIDGDPIVSKSATAEETLLNPADNPGVITVGATDSERSSRSPEMGKPEFWAPSSIKTEKKEEYRGSSNSAAIVAAGISIYKSMNPSADKSDLLEALATQERQEEEVERGPSDLSLADLAFMPTGPRGCFEERPGSSSLAAHVTRLLRRGGKLVNTNYGYRVMVDFDPIVLAEDLERNMPNDMILATPQGFQVANRFERIPFPAGSIEVFQIPADGILCSGSFDHHSSSPKKGIFRLPRL